MEDKEEKAGTRTHTLKLRFSKRYSDEEQHNGLPIRYKAFAISQHSDYNKNNICHFMPWTQVPISSHAKQKQGKMKEEPLSCFIFSLPTLSWMLLPDSKIKPHFGTAQHNTTHIHAHTTLR